MTVKIQEAKTETRTMMSMIVN